MLQPLYTQVACEFADLHDRAGRMKAVGAIKESSWDVGLMDVIVAKCVLFVGIFTGYGWEKNGKRLVLGSVGLYVRLLCFYVYLQCYFFLTFVVFCVGDFGTFFPQTFTWFFGNEGDTC